MAASSYWQSQSTGTGSANQVTHEKKMEDQLRFQIELEFVQCLANPHYLNFLAQHGHFKDSKFVNYLNYLQYWKKPQYAKYLKYPQCLYLLDLLQYEAFRKELVNNQCAKFVDDQQLLHWQHYQRKRNKLINNQMEKQQQQQQTHGQNLHPSHQQHHSNNAQSVNSLLANAANASK